MVVCKCRKATKLYCYVHKVPLCSECICSPEHQICVVKTYSEWVIDGDFFWPPKCILCQEELENETPACRLGCLHVFHTSCFENYLKSFPDNTAPAGYGCPACAQPVWPPQNFRDLATGLPAKLKELISQAGLAGTLLGNVAIAEQPASPAPPAFSSVPLVTVGQGHAPEPPKTGEISEEPSTAPPLPPPPSHPSASQSPMANSLARKNSYRPEKVVIYMEDDGYDEDAARKKYARRGPFYLQALRHLLPFWSPALPTLPVTTPVRKESVDEDHTESHTRRRHHRQATVDPRNILFIFAILSCIATMVLLYYRLSDQSSMSDGSGSVSQM